MNKVDTVIVVGGVVALGIVGWLVVAPLMSGDRKPPTPMPPAQVAPAPKFRSPEEETAVAKLRADNAALMAKPEKVVNEIEVQHCLISFTGAPRVQLKEPRTKEEAEVLASQIYARAKSGEDFDKIVEDYTDDSYPGQYKMTMESRKGMVHAFGDIGWRLDVGEIGCSLESKADSEFGWHIIKRIK
jgi:parvulin-like peptidyl-prolyl isomerase